MITIVKAEIYIHFKMLLVLIQKKVMFISFLFFFLFFFLL